MGIGIAVVDSADAVLVAPIDRAQRIKGPWRELEHRASPRPEAAAVHRPWGWYETL